MAKVTVPSLKKKAWRLFSEFIRRRDSDEDGYCKCVTCGVRKHWTEMQAGHFIPGRTNAILFDMRQVHAQCYGCNVAKNGNWPAYYEFMKKRYGRKEVDQMLVQRHEVVKFTKEMLLDLIEEIKENMKEVI